MNPFNRLAEAIADRMVAAARRLECSDPRWVLLPFADGTPYLVRFKMLKFGAAGGAGVYLHAIVASDDPEPHDHPFTFGSLILLGSYDETILDVETGEKTTRTRRMGSFRIRNASTAHVLTLRNCDTPAITLFIRGPRVKSWGFYAGDPPTWVEWKNWLRGKGHNITG